MPNATTDTRIIFVHGMGAKPPAEDLHALYKKALIENVRIDNGSLAADMESNGTLFVSAYWANAVPDHIEDSTESIQKLTAAVERVIQTRRDLGNDMHISRKGWVKATAEKFGLTIVNALGTALTIKDNVINEHAREVRLYKNDQLIADRIRTPLETALRQAWDDPTISRTVIISHSMGTFISYDVLWRFSHRPEPQYFDYRTRTLTHLITMGSPLGDAALRQFMLVDRWKNAHKHTEPSETDRYTPTNIQSWHNYSAYGDIVCHDSTLKDDFFVPLGRIRTYSSEALRDYVKLYNPYKNTKGKQNPHKSYGYLIQPKLSQNIQWLGWPTGA